MFAVNTEKNTTETWVLERLHALGVEGDHMEHLSALMKLKDGYSVSTYLQSLVTCSRSKTKKFADRFIERRSQEMPLFQKEGIAPRKVAPVEGEVIQRKPYSQGVSGSPLPQKKKKVKSPSPIITSFSEWDERKVKATGNPCYCMATTHDLIGNCRYCGKIICSAEDSRGCTYCHRKLQLEYDPRESDYDRAIDNRNKLLSFAEDRTKRTSVVDDHLDYYEISRNMYLADEDRQFAEEKIQEKSKRAGTAVCKQSTIMFSFNGHEVVVSTHEDQVEHVDIPRMPVREMASKDVIHDPVYSTKTVKGMERSKPKEYIAPKIHSIVQHDYDGNEEEWEEDTLPIPPILPGNASGDWMDRNDTSFAYRGYVEPLHALMDMERRARFYSLALEAGLNWYGFEFPLSDYRPYLQVDTWKHHIAHFKQVLQPTRTQVMVILPLLDMTYDDQFELSPASKELICEMANALAPLLSLGVHRLVLPIADNAVLTPQSYARVIQYGQNYMMDTLQRMYPTITPSSLKWMILPLFGVYLNGEGKENKRMRALYGALDSALSTSIEMVVHAPLQRLSSDSVLVWRQSMGMKRHISLLDEYPLSLQGGKSLLPLAYDGRPFALREACRGIFLRCNYPLGELGLAFALPAVAFLAGRVQQPLYNATMTILGQSFPQSTLRAFQDLLELVPTTSLTSFGLVNVKVLLSTEVHVAKTKRKSKQLRRQVGDTVWGLDILRYLDVLTLMLKVRLEEIKVERGDVSADVDRARAELSYLL